MNETTNPLIGYATAADSLPSLGSALTYLLAGNGIFVSARSVLASKFLCPKTFAISELKVYLT